MPRTKRVRSGIAFSTSTTRRSINEKSPLSRGTSIALIRARRR